MCYVGLPYTLPDLGIPEFEDAVAEHDFAEGVAVLSLSDIFAGMSSIHTLNSHTSSFAFLSAAHCAYSAFALRPHHSGC